MNSSFITSRPDVVKLFSYSARMRMKELRTLRGKFGSLWSQKLKVVFHQFHPIGLLEEMCLTLKAPRKKCI